MFRGDANPEGTARYPQEAERAVSECARIDPSLTTPDAIIGAVRGKIYVAKCAAFNSVASTPVAAL